MRMTVLAILALCTGLAMAVPVRFTADVTRAETRNATAYRGETLDIEATLTDNGRAVAVAPGASAIMYWQTNGMATAWWTAPASVTTSGVIRASWSPTNDVGAPSYRVFLGVTDGGLNYRANMTLRMVGSPGTEPNSLPVPPRTIDFATVSVTNAPWAMPYTAGDNIVISNGVISSTATGGGGGIAEEQDPVWEREKINYADMTLFEAVEAKAAAAESGANLAMGQAAAALALAGTKANAADLGSAAYRDADEFATAADEQLIYQLVMGSNVVMEVTNYNSRVHAPTMRIQKLDPDTREYYTVWTETNGLSRTLSAAKAYTDEAAAGLDAAKASRAWSRHTSGLGADAPAGVTWISTPQTVIAGGYEYAKVATAGGEAWVLTSNGLVADADTNAYFRVTTLDGDEIFSIAKTDAVLIGVDAASISVTGNTVTIPLEVVSDAAPVCLATTNLVGGAWTDLTLSTPSWIDSAEVTGESGAWVWTITTDSPRGFFQFQYLQPGGTLIKHNAPTDLTQGIQINGRKFLPVVTGDTLTWEAQ